MATSSDSMPELSPKQRTLLALLLEQKGAPGTGPVIPRLARTDESPVFPLSFAQQRLWFLDQLDATHAIYNQYTVLRLEGRLDLGALESALNELVARHEILRTVFEARQGQPFQRMLPSLSLPLPIDNLAELPPQQQAAQTRQLIREEITRPFDLARGPLLRAHVLRQHAASHLLVLSMHHIIFDGWSFGIIVREMAALYQAARDGRVAKLPSPPLQYADFAAWQRSELTQAAQHDDLAYWSRQLAGAPALLALPTDTPRPAVQRYRGCSCEQRLPPSLLVALTGLSRREGATLFMTLLAGFQALLSRYSGQTDLLVGTPIAGRTQVELEQVVGCFVNMLALRTDLSGNPSCQELLGRVRTVALEAYAHQELPFEQVVEALQPARSLSYSPIFQVLFALQNVPLPPLELEGLRMTPVEAPTTTAKFDLLLIAQEQADELRLVLEYDTDLFSASTAERLLRHYVQLLSAMVASPSARLHELAMLSPQEQAQLLNLGSGASLPYPHSTIPALFFAQAARTPLAPALLYGEVRLNYASLAEQAARLAHLLRAHGVGPEVRVGVCLERSPLLVVALLGLLAAGGAYVPLDPHYPPARRHLILADAGIALVLTETALLERLAPVGGVALLALDTSEVREASAAAPTTPPQVPLDPDNLAYVIYTSGSTGTPKGVLGLHRGALNRFEWMWTTYPFGPDELLCQKTALGFLDSLWEIFGPLLRGQPLLLVPEATLADPTALVELLAEQSVTRLVLVPSLLQALLESQADLARRLPRLWLWVSSGEALGAALTQRFQEALPGRTLLNLYGASELSADATVQELGQRQLQGAGAPIGQPLANLQVYVLDEQLALVPVGVEGELYVGGVGLARGYHGRPDLTAERFIPNPFATTEDRRPTTDDETNGGGGRWSVVGGRLYRTGDRVRWSAEGVLEYVGRRDGQVQVRGFRVEVTEVEAALAGHEAVEVAVVVAQGSGAERRLVAYIVEGSEVRGQGSAEQALDTLLPDLRSLIPELRAYLAERLPGYMVPSLFVRLAAMPLTPSGKIDRRALPTPYDAQDVADEPALLPRTQLEQIIAEVWASMLQLATVDIRSNFFDLGGHSLLLVRVQAQLCKRLEREISIVELLAYPSVESLAHYLSGGRQDQAQFQQEHDRVKAGKEARRQRLAERRGGG